MAPFDSLALREDEASGSPQDLPVITSKAEAERFCADIEQTMESLIQLVEEETRLVRSGKLFAAGELELTKSVTARRYISAMQEVREIAPTLERLAPVAINRLRSRHAGFRATLQINLAVLATAREVSEDLVRSVAEGVGAGAAPRGYGRTGTVSAPPSADGIAINRAL